MNLTITPTGSTLTNLIPDPFPTANFLGLQIKILSGPPVTSIAIDEAASAPGFRQGIVASASPDLISVNLSGGVRRPAAP